MAGRHGGRIFDLAQGEAGPNAGHAGNLGQAFKQQGLELDQIFDHHAKHEVGFAAHEIALHHFGPPTDGLSELLQRCFVLLLERHVDEHVDCKSQFQWIHQLYCPSNHATLLEVGHPPPAGRRRQTYPISQLGVAYFGVFLQRIQDSEAGFVHLNGIQGNLFM